MDQASFFIERKALFGGYPKRNQVIELMKEGVVWFVDLTNANEKGIVVYSHLVDNWINFPIKDGQVPENKKNFLIFIVLLQLTLEKLKSGEKLYLHCRGGHGRSSLVIACLLCLLFKISPYDSLYIIKEYHSLRPNLKSKWLNTWPLNTTQRHFVESFFGTLYFYSGVTIKHITSKSEIYKYMILLNLYIHQNKHMLNVFLNSGLKTLKGEGIVSEILEKLRLYIFYSTAHKILG